jgi:hypothetical protein
MKVPTRYFPLPACAVILFCVPSFAQTADRRQSNAVPPEQSASLPANANSLDVVASEMGLIRKSLQTLNTRLRELSERAFTGADQSGAGKQSGIAANLDLLTRAEQRAEVMRKQLIELTEKETSFKTRLAQLDDDLRPESIERVISVNGSTRTPELREVRRRVLDTERRGTEALLNQTSQGRLRLEEDLKQADGMVYRLRQRLLPLIDKEIEKINPN